MTAEDEGIRLVPGADLAEGVAHSFSFRDSTGILADAFVIRFKGQIHAYRNQCRHVPLTLDYGDGDVFSEDKDYLVCRNHGAVYDPATGQCLDGPCNGASLLRIPAAEVDGWVVAWPEQAESGPDLD